MVVNIPDNGLVLESSAKAIAGLPTQAFAISLSDSVIEDMIECFNNGQGLQLSLGSNPVSSGSAILFGLLLQRRQWRTPTIAPPHSAIVDAAE